MERYAPSAKDLASRDVVSRSMTIEINEGRGVGDKKDHILLNLSHLPPDILAERLPGISETANIFAGVDVTKEPVPVIPTVHYNMGGIPTNWKGQVLNPSKPKDNTIVHGLWAAGEAASTSVHGANRLGANSLLDIVVFGKACAENIHKIHNDKPIEECDEKELHRDLDKYHFYKHKKGDINVSDLRLEMQNIMQKHAGVFRNDELLLQGVDKMQNIYKQFQHVSIDDKSDTFNSEFIELLELKNLLDNSLITMHSANYRKESRGAHSHENYPKRDDDNWLCHTLAKLKNINNIAHTKVALTKRDVIFSTLNKEVNTIPLAQRVY